MKRYYLFLGLLLGFTCTYAQSEMKQDSLTRLPVSDLSAAELILPETKSFGGFLIDMTLLNLQTPPLFSDYKLEIPDATKDYNQIFKLNPSMTFSQEIFRSDNLHPFAPTQLQMSSFKLKNGMRINTYGEYNKEGRKVPNPSALPWERNDFKGAFELKSANGSFGFRLEVQQNR